MDTIKILAEIDAEIQRLQHARSVLNGGTVVKRGPGRPKRSVSGVSSAAPKRRRLSAEARAKIAAAQKARWAKAKKA
jgi:hypothetical protein